MRRLAKKMHVRCRPQIARPKGAHIKPAFSSHDVLGLRDHGSCGLFARLSVGEPYGTWLVNSIRVQDGHDFTGSHKHDRTPWRGDCLEVALQLLDIRNAVQA